MKKIFIGLTAAVSILAAAGCTDATRSKFAAYGAPHQVKCWNYQQEIYNGVSTGRINHDKEGASDTISFEDANTKELVEIMLGQSTTCIIKVK